MIDTMQATTDDRYLALTSEPTTSGELDLLSRRMNEVQTTLEMLRTLKSISETSGGYVQFRKEYLYLPVVMGNNNRPVAMFRFVEVLDESVDYEKVKDEFPNLSYSQIHGAISFLRKVAQVNALGIDIDGVQSDEESQDTDLLDALAVGVADQEIARVLHHDK